MGGQGSGGWNRKYQGTTEEAIQLAMSDLKNAGLSNRAARWKAHLGNEWNCTA